MSVTFSKNATRQSELSGRSFAETILGNSYVARIYSTHKGVGRGTAALRDLDGYSVHTAYVIGDDLSSQAFITGTAIGVLIENKTRNISVVLSANDTEKSIWYQYEIAEAVDFWEKENSPKIYCLNEKSCGAVVFCDEDGERKYVVIRMNSGHRGLPKGHIEKYENEIMAAKREVFEEIGVEITLVTGFRVSVEYSISPRARKESVYFLGRFNGGEIKIQESEICSYKLCSYNDARRIITYENDRAVLDAAEKLLAEK